MTYFIELRIYQILYKEIEDAIQGTVYERKVKTQERKIAGLIFHLNYVLRHILNMKEFIQKMLISSSGQRLSIDVMARRLNKHNRIQLEGRRSKACLDCKAGLEYIARYAIKEE